MSLDSVQFGTYRFAHNPREIHLTETRRTTVEFLPFLGEKVRQLGRGVTEVVCEGELLSDSSQDSLAEYERLRTVYEKGAEELLFLPGRQPFPAYFDRLELLAQGDGRALRYRARFVESRSYGGNR